MIKHRAIDLLFHCFFAFAALLTTSLVHAGDAEASGSDDPVYDIVVFGDSSGAVSAAISAKREGRSVILVNPARFLGGMSSSGLGATDFGNGRKIIGGIASEFYGKIAAAYGKNFVRSFEPHVGERIFGEMIAEAGVPVVLNEKLDRDKGVKMDGRRITSITTLSGKTYRGKMFIDASYVGDLMAAAGVTYTVGREAEAQYGEDLAGVRRGDTNPRKHYTQRDKDHFTRDVDPHVTRGDPESGLLPYVFKIDGLANGQGDKKIQAYNYRLCLTTDPKLRIPIEKPAGYRELDHELLLRNFEAGDERMPALIERLAGTGSKVDWNSMHAVGSDYGGANWEYPETGYERRREIEKAHETYIRGFLWTLANSPRVPEKIRKQAGAYGLPKDEFTDNGGWPYMIYIREARRMVSDYVMTQADCEHRRKAKDPVGFGAFGMDSHVVQYFVNEKGHVRRDGTIWRVPPGPYGISYRSIIPRKGECENLYSPVCLSASHVAHGSIRMEPVFMVLGQSAALAAGLAIDRAVSVQEVDYGQLRQRLEADKQIVRPGQPGKSGEGSIGAAGAALAGGSSSEAGADAAARANVLMICIDDLNDWTGFLGGHPEALTPRMDALAERGRNFSNAHCAVPVCSCSRASVMSGVAATTHGSYEIGPSYQQLPALSNAPTIQQHFKDNGYVTLAGGKVLHHDFGGRLAGAIDRSLGRKRSPRPKKPVNRPSDWSAAWDWGAYPETDAEMADIQLANNAAKALKEDFEKPFFMTVGFFRPHVPLFVPQKWFDLYDAEKITLPRNPKSDLDDVPKNFLAINDYALAPTHAEVVEHGRQRSLTQAYLASVSFVDHCVGIVLDALKASPHAENTLIVLWSDHGFHLGEKQHWAKRTLWEESTRVPLLFAGPGIKPGKPCPEPASLIDIYPTLIGLCRLPANPRLQGLSLVPQVNDPATPRDRPAITSSYFGNHSIRTRDWRLISYQDGARELYDHRSDPDEFHNLANNPKHKATVDRLSQWLPKKAAPEFKTKSERSRARKK